MRDDPIKPSTWDESSYANVEAIHTKDFDLNIFVDFDKSTISGTNTLTLRAVEDQVGEVILDYQGMVITKVEAQDEDGTFKTTTYETQEFPILGNAIRVNLLNSNNFSI